MKNKTKLVIAFILIAVLAAGLIAVAVNLNNQITTSTVSSLEYRIGGIDEEGTLDTDVVTSIVTKNYVTVDGLEIELNEDAKVTYQVFFYDEDREYVSASEANLSTTFSGSVPETAKFCKIVIKPTIDPEVSWTEISKYAGMVTVTTNR